MNEIKDIIFEILKNHPRGKDGISVDELTKLLYLISWKYAVDHKKQLTNTKWYYGDGGPQMKN